MPAFNQVIMVGNLTTDPQLSYTTAQTPVVDTGLAVNRTWRGPDGEKHEETCFIDVRGFGRLAEALVKYTQKGTCVLVQGYLALERWDGRDGSKHSKHRLIAQSVQFLFSKASRVDVGSAGAEDGDIPY